MQLGFERIPDTSVDQLIEEGAIMWCAGGLMVRTDQDALMSDNLAPHREAFVRSNTRMTPSSDQLCVVH